MEKNGFTLIELLGVITLLLLITLLVLPSVTGVLKSLGSDQDEVMTEMIYDAAKLYVSDSDGKYKNKEGNIYCITLETLVDEGYLKSPITLSESDVDITSLKSIELSYNNGSNYKLMNKDSCVEMSTGCTVVSGDLNTIGSEVQCGSEYFYVINSNDTTIDLLSKYNLNIGNNIYSSMETGIQNQYTLGYKSGYTTYGGIPLTNISDLNQYFEYYENYIEEKNSISISIGLMTSDQALSLTSYDWLYSTSYWLGTSSTSKESCYYVDFYDCIGFDDMDNIEYFYHVSSEKDVNNTIYLGGYLSSNTAFGIRPVITVNKSEIN